VGSSFSTKDHDKLAALLKQHFGVILEVKDVSFKGWNWGVTDFQGDALSACPTSLQKG
jgi:structure-specific recognition protein 1